MSLPADNTAANDDAFTYGSYLKIPELLALQQCVSIDEETGGPEHDETLFIIIHQVYELWFKQLLHELDHVVGRLNEHKVSSARHHLKRVLKILKTLVGQIDVLETMTPAEFANDATTNPPCGTRSSTSCIVTATTSRPTCSSETSASPSSRTKHYRRSSWSATATMASLACAKP